MIDMIRTFSLLLHHTTTNIHPNFCIHPQPKYVVHTQIPFLFRKRSSFHVSSVLSLNRFLFDPSEVEEEKEEEEEGQNNEQQYDDEGRQAKAKKITVTLPKSDYRTIHAAKILNLHNGDTIRAGIVGEYNDHDVEGSRLPCPEDDTFNNDLISNINVSHGGLITDEAVITWLPEGKIKKAEPTKNGEPPGSLHIELKSLSYPNNHQSTEKDIHHHHDNHHHHDTPPLFPTDYSISLILALPRPLQLSRMLPMMAQMGVDHIVLTQAQKVPKDYFGSHLFRKPHELQRHLIEGLCQAGDVRLPKVTVVKRLKVFLEDDLEAIFPKEEYARVIAHPLRQASSSSSSNSSDDSRIRNISFPNDNKDNKDNGVDKNKPRLVLAVGPEGGWAEDYELDMFRSHGFEVVTLGSRILRSDVAVVSLLSLAHDACVDKVLQNWNNQGNE